MGRDLDAAHYLHRKRGLAMLVRPPVSDATWMVWDGDGQLLVATEHGRVERVHPALGTRTLVDGLDGIIGLGAHERRVVVVESGGAWRAYDVSGEPLFESGHPFEGPVHVQFRDGKTLLTGPVGSEEQMLFYEGARKVLRIQLPPRAVGFIRDGRLGLARATPAGLETIYLAAGGRFRGREQTGHDLHPFSDHIVGVHAGGVRVWSLADGSHVDVELPGATACALADEGRTAAVGTSEGEVALVDLGTEEGRRDPVIIQITDEPIRTLAFSPDGRFLATGADSVVLWSWA